MMAKKRVEPESWYMAPKDPDCPLCERPIPKPVQDKHHLVPRLKGGTETEMMHRICHRQIHALFSEAELAQRYNTVDALLTHPDIQKFVAWVKSKPPTFNESVKLGRHRK